MSIVWQPIETAPKDGRRLLLWVCPRGFSRRSGYAEMCWRGEHPHWGESWLRHNGKEIVGEGVATHWAHIVPPKIDVKGVVKVNDRD